MKIPLRYQVSEFDCGTVSLLNAVSYLFERKNIPVELVRSIHLYTIDCYDSAGYKSNDWMANESISKMCSWITNCSVKNDFKLDCVYLAGEQVTYDNLIKCIRKDGVVFIKCWREELQYLIITNMNELNTYVFDPYYQDDDAYDKDEEVRIVQSKPFDYNRIVRTDRLFSENHKDFCLGSIKNRECVLMNRKGK
jgi:hypothetical protein